MAEELSVEGAGLAVWLEPELLLEQLVQAVVAADDGATHAECCFGLHREASFSL